MTDQFKARPTVYKGIQMRSRLEAGFAAWLDENNFEWAYEPCAFATEDGQYLPDFLLRNVFAAWTTDLLTVYVEVKPESFGRAGDDLLRLGEQARIIHASEPQAMLLLMQPANPPQLLVRQDDGFGDRWLLHSIDFIPVWDDRIGLSVGSARWPWPPEYWRVGR